MEACAAALGTLGTGVLGVHCTCGVQRAPWVLPTHDRVVVYVARLECLHQNTLKHEVGLASWLWVAAYNVIVCGSAPATRSQFSLSMSAGGGWILLHGAAPII